MPFKSESLAEKDVFFGFCRLILVKCKYVFKGHIIIVDVVNRCSDVAYGIVFNNYSKRLKSNKDHFWHFLLIAMLKK